MNIFRSLLSISHGVRIFDLSHLVTIIKMLTRGLHRVHCLFIKNAHNLQNSSQIQTFEGFSVFCCSNPRWSGSAGVWLAATYTASYSTPTLSNNLVTSIYGLRDLDPVRNWSQNTSTHNIFILQHFLFGYDGIHLPVDTLPLRAYYIILSI